MPDGPSVTLDSVAERAGVSRQTVSNVLRHPQRVAGSTRERVLAVIRESGYRPSLPARQLATRRAHAVAVRAERQQDGISGLVLDAFYHGLAEAGHDRGLRVLLYAQQADEATELALVDELVGTGGADAVVLTATSADDGRPAHLRERGLTFCAFGRPWGAADGDDPHDWVDVDGAAGTALAVAHLVETGHRRIGYLGWPGDGITPSTGSDRRRGWVDELRRRGLAAAPESQCPNDVVAAETVAAGLFTRHEIDALVCASDTLALGAHRAALAGARAVTVVGFDATPVSAALGLASVQQPIEDAARHCIELLHDRFAAPDAPARGLLVPPTLRTATTDRSDR